MKSHNQITDQKGFTLIELLMTVIIVSVISIPISLTIAEHYRNLLQTSDYSLGLDLARDAMEIANNLAVDNLTSSTVTDSGYDIVRTISYIAPSTSSSAERLVKVLIEVKRTGSAAVILSLTTYRVRNVAYGL